jgi:hypothetical protein
MQSLVCELMSLDAGAVVSFALFDLGSHLCRLFEKQLHLHADQQQPQHEQASIPSHPVLCLVAETSSCVQAASSLQLRLCQLVVFLVTADGAALQPAARERFARAAVDMLTGCVMPCSAGVLTRCLVGQVVRVSSARPGTQGARLPRAALAGRARRSAAGELWR